MSSSTSASHGVIDNSANPKITNFKASFIRPGQFVEYYFYARNEGEYTAYLNSINFIGEKVCEEVDGTTKSLVDAACSGINITVSVEGVNGFTAIDYDVYYVANASAASGSATLNITNA
jgi:hypothetical protein